MAFCTQCGAQQVDGVKFCTSCGQTMATPAAQEPVQEPPPPVQEPQMQQVTPEPPPPPAPPQMQQPPAYQPPPPAYQPTAQQPPAYQPPQPGYPPPPPGVAAYPYGAGVQPIIFGAQGNFREVLHSVGGSILFLVGIILFTAGSIIGAFIPAGSVIGAVISAFIPAGIVSVFSLIWLVLPLIAFWLIFAASKNPRLPEKIITAMTLLKVKTIIELILMCLLILVLLIVSVVVFVAAGAATTIVESNIIFGFIPDIADFIYGIGDIVSFIGIVMMAGVVIVLIIVIIYYKSLLSVLGSISNGIKRGWTSKISGIGVFSVFTYIGIVFSVISALTSLGTTDFMYEFIWSLPYEIQEYAYWLLPSGNVRLTAALTVITNAGIFLCVLSLGKLGSKVKQYRI